MARFGEELSNETGPMAFINSLISSMSLKFPAMTGVEFLQEPSPCEAAQIKNTAKIQEQFVPRKKEKSICSPLNWKSLKTECYDFYD